MTHPAPQHATLDDWIAREAAPVADASPAALEAAIATILASLGDSVELLGFGEALHGGEDVLMLRNRLFRQLVTAHGFCAIAIESSFPRGRLTNDYVLGRGPASYDALIETGFSHGFGQLEANRELVEWMREYNLEASHSVKLHFYGFDQPALAAGPASPSQVLRLALDYLAEVDGIAAGAYRDRIDPLLGQDDGWENPVAWYNAENPVGLSPNAQALRIATEDLATELRIRRPEFVAKSDEDRYLEAVHHASLARQFLSFYADVARAPSRSLGVRDALMADNLAYIVARERARGKVLAFAHNMHLQRGEAEMPAGPDTYRWWPAGAHLNAIFGPRYAVIGSAVGVSEANGIGQPEADTLEARLTAVPGPLVLVPTHRGQGLPDEEVAGLPTRSGSQKNPSYFSLNPQSLSSFDWLAVLDSTAYNRGGRPLP
jgi:erythromycin esterase-like protein